jgi:hypothetical protein
MTVRKLLTASLLAAGLALVLPACTGKEETPPPAAEETTVDETAEHVAVCRGAMQKLGAALKSRLQSAMAEGGPIGALQVCNVEATPIAETISIEEGVLVGRTSLRTRNPRNRPDEWERGVLETFAERCANGEDVAALDAWTITENAEGQRTFRYMKAIPTGSMCLLCHGTEIESGVTAKLAELYPQDAAVGFAEGDIRGAFTVVKPLD